MKRRDLIFLLLTAAAVGRAPIAAGQSARQVGLFYPFSRTDPGMVAADTAFRSELARLGWKQGSNLVVDECWEEANPERLRALAKQLVEREPNAIFVIGALGTSILHETTSRVPVVFDNIADPIRLGLVSSFPHPGGNITGFTNLEFSIVGKWIGMAKDAAPYLVRAAFIYNPDTSGAYIQDYLDALTSAAPAFAIEIIPMPVRDEAAIEHAIDRLGSEPGNGLIIGGDIFTYYHRDRIAALANLNRLPSVFQWREGALAGGLMSYGPDNVDLARRAAGYIDRILRGEGPAELPIQQPVKFELLVNLKTAKALGLTIPASLLARADEVIE